MELYTPFPGEQTLPAPGLLSNTSYFAFFLRPKAEALKGCCDRYFNKRLAASGSGIRYQPVGVVMLAFTHVDALTSSDPKTGSIRYKDIAFWIPVVAKHPNELPHVCMFPLALFVDNAATMVTGREMFGLPKQQGSFRMPLEPGNIPGMPAPQFRLEVVGDLQEGGPRDWRTLLTISARPGVGDAKSFTRQAADAVGALHGLLDLPNFFDGRGLPEFLRTARALGLRQFRDPSDPKLATYTSIVEAPLTVDEVIGDVHFFHDDFELDIEAEPVPSHHGLIEELGLETGRQDIKAAVFFKANLSMKPGRTVWSQP